METPFQNFCRLALEYYALIAEGFDAKDVHLSNLKAEMEILLLTFGPIQIDCAEDLCKATKKFAEDTIIL